MLRPALRALAHGELAPDRLERLLDGLRLEPTPRTEGPGASASTAHRAFTDAEGTPLVLDLSRVGTSGWVLTLFHGGQRPCTGTVEDHRARFRDAVDRLGLTLVEIEPAATADEVHVVAPAPAGAPGAFPGAHWSLPDELDRLWMHLGLRRDAPREVKEVTLRALTRAPAWSAAPVAVRRQVAEFLGEH
ncbi:hypothetical protein [Streptomyces sp. NPDC005955]|uniref:hypothetical protein n=1 Tax=Streptomyces sp. NPDC005955 TaxID=3364738 RepID=UPI0036A61218